MSDAAQILRVFADPKKVKLLGLICGEALPLHTLARAAGVSEGETMALLASLKEAGLLHEEFAADGFRWQYQPKALFKVLAALKQDTKPSDFGEAFTAEEAGVLGDFIVNGRLKTIPAQRKKRDVVLRYLVQRFEHGRTYTEQEVNFILLDYHEDYASLRREMVDTRLMRRENSIYQRFPTV